MPFSTLRDSQVTIHLLGIFTLIMKKIKHVTGTTVKNCSLATFTRRQHVNIGNCREGKDSCLFDVWQPWPLP